MEYKSLDDKRFNSGPYEARILRLLLANLGGCSYWQVICTVIAPGESWVLIRDALDGLKDRGEIISEIGHYELPGEVGRNMTGYTLPVDSWLKQVRKEQDGQAYR